MIDLFTFLVDILLIMVSASMIINSFRKVPTPSWVSYVAWWALVGSVLEAFLTNSGWAIVTAALMACCIASIKFEDRAWMNLKQAQKELEEEADAKS